MLSFRDLFTEYIKRDNEETLRKIEGIVKEKCDKRDYYALDDFDLIYLYRQARFFNLQNELSINNNSQYYLYKEKKIISFFSLINLPYNHGPLFPYDKEANKISLLPFLGLLATFTVDCKANYRSIIRQMVKLFDTESLTAYAYYCIKFKSEENKQVEEVFSIIFDTWFNNVQITEDVTQVLLYAKEHMLLTSEKEREEYRSLFENLNYEQHYLTHKSKCFLLLANECSETFANSAFFDFSIVSLQYYKIIETEIKQKLLRPSAKNIKENCCYLTKGITIKRNESEFNFLSLEKIETIFSMACDAYYFGYPTGAKDFLESLFKLCNSNVEYLGYFRDITSMNFRDKYRNPPAHTEPLNGENLDEMIAIYESFIENMRRIHERIKNPPVRPQIIETVLRETKKDRRY